jgi:hypothetical protein
MRNPELIKADYPASGISEMHKKWKKGIPPDAVLAADPSRGRLNSSRFGLFFCDKKNGQGWTLILTRYCRKVSVNNRVGKWAENIFVYFTPTPNGLRVMAIFNKKKAWGLSGVNSMLIREGVGYEWQTFLTKNFSAEDFIPQAKFLKRNENMPAMTPLLNMSPYVLGLMARHPGVKGVMNEIYEKTKNNIPKDLFNGALQQPLDLHTLMCYVYIARAFGGYGESGLAFIRKMNLQMTEYPVELEDQEEFVGTENPTNISSLGTYCKTSHQVCMSDLSRDVRRYGEFFRHSEHSFNKICSLFIEGESCCMMSYKIKDVMSMMLELDRKNRKMVRQWYRGSRDVDDLHDHLANIIEMMEHEDHPINIKKLSQFEGDVGHGIVCIVPKSTHELWDWGNSANICIGSYADRVRQGKTYCFAFGRNDIKIGFAEVSTEMKLKQLLGKYNQKLSDEDRYPIIVYLKNKGVNCSNYWGM